MQDQQPTSVDRTRPTVARVYDFSLGGKDNFAVDRRVTGQMLQLVPEANAAALTNRDFLRRVVRYMVTEAGVRQFLDIGSGLPAQVNVHDIAQALAPDARVVYVDHDPMVLAHGQALLANNETTTVVTADLREPEGILGDPAVRRFIDFDRPVGLLLMAVLHHLDDDEDPAGVAGRLRGALAPGSHMALSHFHNPGSARPEDAEMAVASERQFRENLGSGRFRTREEILTYFGDFEVLEPGLVPLPQWRPDTASPDTLSGVYHRFLGGVART